VNTPGADVLEAAPLHRQSLRTGNELRARLNGNLGVPERDALEVGVVRGAHVKQGEVAGAVEDDWTVTGSLDRNRHVLGAVGGQVIRCRRAARCD
jgi:hypothetical protein